MVKYYVVGAPGSGTRFIAKVVEELFLKDGGFEADKERGTTPHHQTYRINKAVEAGYKVIHLVRDGRSQIYSRILDKHGIDSGIIKNFNIKVPDEKHLNYAILWNFFVEEGIKGRGHENYLEIKYEDFCMKPVTTINKISKFLKLDFDKEEFEKIRLKIKPSLDKYKNFNSEELEEINKIIKPNMEKLGYELEE